MLATAVLSTVMPSVSGETGRPSDETAWDAVTRRDRSFDGRFVYAVRSTGVFCRPTSTQMFGAWLCRAATITSRIRL